MVKRSDYLMGYRSRAGKHELQRFADETRVRVHVSHFPPGTSKWN